MNPTDQLDEAQEAEALEALQLLPPGVTLTQAAKWYVEKLRNRIPIPPGQGKSVEQPEPEPQEWLSGPIPAPDDRAWFGKRATDPIGHAVETVLGKTRVYDGLTDVSK